MNTDKEITAIKERLNHLEATLEDLCQPSGEAFEFIDFSYERTETDTGSERYTYTVTIKNTTNEGQGFSGYIVFLDSDGCELHRDGIDFFSVPAGVTHSQDGYAEFFDKIQMMKIAELEADVFALPHHRPETVCD
jgi:hypothetical protein